VEKVSRSEIRKIFIHGFEDFRQIFSTFLPIFRNFYFLFRRKIKGFLPQKIEWNFSIVLTNFAKFFSRGFCIFQ
jgi:hypothetical protein